MSLEINMLLQKGFQAILKTGGGSADCKYLQLLAYLDSFASWLLFISFGTRAQRLTLGIVCLGKYCLKGKRPHCFSLLK